MTTTLDTLLDQLKAITKLLEERIDALTVSGKQVVTPAGLSDIDVRLGLIQAGEFRTGNGVAPGHGFTGGRFGYPGFVYGADTYFLAGVENDVLQVGLSITDGTIQFGAGSGWMDSNGIQLLADGLLVLANGYKFVDPADTTKIMGGLYSIVRHDAFDDVYVDVRAQPQDSTLVSVYSQLSSVSSSAAIARMTVDSGLNAGAAGILKIAQTTTTEIGIENVDLINFTDVKVDLGSEHRLEIGQDHYIPTRNGSNKTTYFNEANQDMDFNVQSVNDDNMFYVDAGLDAIGIAGAADSTYKLKVTGKINATEGFYKNGNKLGQIIQGHSAAVNITAGQTRYITFHMDATESLVYLPVPVAGTFKNLYVYTQGSPGVGQSWTCTLRKTLADTAVTCTISAGTNTASDTTHSVAFSAGDRWALKVVASAGAASSDVALAIEFVPD